MASIDPDDIATIVNSTSPSRYVADTYTTRIPAPPRVSMPGPILHEEAIISLQRTRPSFLYDSISWNPTEADVGYIGWTYMDRRKPQRILPYLYLGPSPSATAVDWMRGEHISFAIGIANSVPKVVQKGLERAAELGAKTDFIDVPAGQDLTPVFTKTCKLIEDHVNTLMTFDQPPRVFVFCESGNDRSAALVIAFITQAYKIDFSEAIRAVQTIRFSVVMFDDFKQMLQNYHDIVRARNEVATANSVPGAKKRGLERDDDEVNDDSRQYAPFEDRMDTA